MFCMKINLFRHVSIFQLLTHTPGEKLRWKSCKSGAHIHRQHVRRVLAGLMVMEIGNCGGGGAGCKVKGVIITHLSAASKLVFCMI